MVDVEYALTRPNTRVTNIALASASGDDGLDVALEALRDVKRQYVEAITA